MSTQSSALYSQRADVGKGYPQPAEGFFKRIIVHADDFGLTAGINRGIVKAFKNGILTSTSLMPNGEAFEDAVRLS